MCLLYYFTKNNSIERFFQDFKDSPLCKNYTGRIEQIKNKPLPVLPEYLKNSLRTVEDTLKKVRPLILNYTNKIVDPILRGGIEIAYDLPWWHDRSFVLRSIMEAFGKKFEGRILDLAISTELFYLSSIIFDEIVDNQETCMHIPTFWTRLSEGKDRTIGKFRAECIKEELETLSLKALVDLIRKHKVESTKAMNLIETWNEMKGSFYEGQSLDLELQYKENPKIKEGMNMIEKIEADPTKKMIEMASILTNLDKNSYEKATKIGYLIGKATKLRDDIVDFVGEFKALGKMPGGDLIISLKEGKYVFDNSNKTIPVILTIEAIKKGQIEIHGTDIYSYQKEKLIKKIKKSEVIDQSKNYLSKLIAETKILANDLSGNKTSLENIIKLLGDFSI